MPFADSDPPDLTLMDLSVSGIDGWEVAHCLKADPPARDIAQVAVTALTLSDGRKQALDAGINNYIFKPINVTYFNEQVGGYLKRMIH